MIGLLVIRDTSNRGAGYATVRAMRNICTAFGLLFVMTLAACGGGSVGVDTASGSTTTTTTTTTTAVATAPPAPTGLQAIASSAQVALTWSASTGATSYIVKRSTGGGTSFTQIGAPTATSYADTGLTNGTAYSYIVIAVNSAGQSAASADATATPMAAVTAPAAPAGLNAQGGNAQVALAWAATAGATSYIVKRGAASGGPFTQVGTSTTTSYINTGLTNGTAYFYVVVAANSVGQSAASAVATATPTATVTAPAAPTGLAAKSGNAQVALAWTASAGATSYIVKRGASSGGPFTQVATSTTTSYTNTGLTNGTAYFYVVLAVNSAGQSAASAVASATPAAPVTKPAAPAGLTAKSGNAEVTLAWTASTGASSYIVTRAAAAAGPYTQIGTSVSTSYTATGLTNGTAYYFEVLAVNTAGSSAPSADATATPSAAVTAPAAPSGLTATDGNAQVSLSWTASSGATSYHVKRATVSGGPYTVVAMPASVSYVDTGLMNGSTFYYVVSAVNSVGESANSSQVTGTPTSTVGTSGPPAVCTAPFGEDTSATTVTVGTGTAASCTESALASALAKGGVIRFSCGGPATITLTSQKTLRTDVNTTLDGQNMITLDGKGATRLLYYYASNFQVTKTQVTIQNITLQNGASSGTPIPSAPAPCSQGTENDGGGAAIYFKDGILHVWNTIFKNNVGAATGPDIGGGAIYSLGSLGTTIVGSTFISNRAANGGAIGALFGDLSIYNSQFTSNAATGSGANTVSSSCSVNGGEVGNGGDGGAVLIDGGENYAVNVCGSTFTSNTAGSGALGGAIFRTPDVAIQTTTIDRSSFVGNTAPNGGALYFHNSNLVITASTLSGNTASVAGGAIASDDSTLNFTNDTFANNIAQKGLGGAIVLYGNGGTLQNVTFVGNQSTGGSGYFAAAIGGGTTLTINNTLFAENTDSDCNSPMQCLAGSSSGAHDLQWPKTHTVCATVDTLCTPTTAFSNPELGTLQSNGGPTQTAAPIPGSPAVGIGQNCPSTDQRGIARPTSNCTSGAVEGAISP